MSKSISVEFCSYFCKNSHKELKDGWLPTCNAFPDGKTNNNHFHEPFRMRECANGYGFEPNENVDEHFYSFYCQPNPWTQFIKLYLITSKLGSCPYCNSEDVRFYSDAPFTSFNTLVCYGCGKRYRYQSDRISFLDNQQLLYIGNNPLFPLTNRKIYVCNWIENGMYLICDDTGEEHLYPLYVFEKV